MWLVLVAATVTCEAPSQELRLRVADSHGAAVSGAEVRKWSGQEPREPVLGVTDASGTITICVSPEAGDLGIYLPGFQSKKLASGADQIVLTLESATPIVNAVTLRKPPCVTGSTKEGGYRFCSDILSRLPLRD